MDIFKRFRRAEPPSFEEVVKLLLEFINAETWSDSKLILESNQDVLLSDRVDPVFDRILKQYQGQPAAQAYLQEHRALLELCRTKGIGPAFVDRLGHPKRGVSFEEVYQAIMSLAGAMTRQERRRVIEAHQDSLLSQLADQVLNSLIEESPEESDVRGMLEELRALLDRCRQYGIAAAFSGGQDGSDLPEVPSDAMQLARDFIHADTWQESRAFLEDHQDFLISGQGVAALEAWLGQEDNPAGRQILQEHIDLLKRCCEQGLDAAFEEQEKIAKKLLSSSVKLQALLQRISRLQDAGGDADCRILYLQALTLIDQQEMPEAWGSLHGDLAKCLMEHPAENVEDEIEQALFHYKQALKVFTRRAHPEEWAMTQDHLGSVYAQRKRGNKKDNLQEAVRHWMQALEVSTRKKDPEGWAAIQNNLANALLENDIEASIGHYEQALQVYTREEHPQDWAMVQNGLATAYWGRTMGDAGENIERSIVHYLLALEVVTELNNGSLWARVNYNLGDAYRMRRRGEPAENIEQSITYYMTALKRIGKVRSPDTWAKIQSHLGDLFADRVAGGRLANIETAIRHYRNALEVYTKTGHPLQWAETQNSLGVIYLDRIQGETEGNFQTAIHHFMEALRVFDTKKHPEEWAITQNNLGNAYLGSSIGDLTGNIQEAISHYKQALTVFSLEQYAERWAMTQNNLGNAYHRVMDVELARRHYEQALLVYTIEAHPRDWAMVHNNLAAISPPELGIEHHRKALQVRTREAQPVQWAASHLNLARLLSFHAGRDRDENISLAVQHYRKALEVYTRHQFPVENRNALRELGDLFFEEGKWSHAVSSYEDAILAGEHLQAEAFTETGLRTEIGKSAQMYMRAAYCLLRLNAPEKAFLTMEEGKTRLLRDAMAWENVDLFRLTPDEREGFQQARNSVRRVRAQMRSRMEQAVEYPELELAREAEQASTQLRDQVGRLRMKYPDFMPSTVDLTEVLRLLPEDSALVAPLITSQGSAIFVIPAGTDRIDPQHVVWLDHFTDADVRHMLGGSGSHAGWLVTYRKYRHSVRDVQIEEMEASVAGDPVDLETWKDEIDWLTGQLWMALIEPVLGMLKNQNTRQVILLPQGGLGLLPLHAAWHRENDAVRFFLDDYDVVYAPSTHVLSLCVDRSDKTVERKGLVVGVDEYLELGRLNTACAEASVIASMFGAPPLLNSEASVDAVLSAAAGAGYLHLACHGSFGWETPLASSLYFARDEPLSLTRVLSGAVNLESARVVTLSACETGFTDIGHLPEEFVGLPVGFLQAGAASVVSSLWTVDDASTELLMWRFYHNHLDLGMTPSQALCAAQRWLRGVSRSEIGGYYRSTFRRKVPLSLDAYSRIMTEGDPDDHPYAHPYYWAAFTFTGVQGKGRTIS